MTWVAIDKQTGKEVARYGRFDNIERTDYGYAHSSDLPEYTHWRAVEFDGDRAVGFVEDVKARDAALLDEAEASRFAAYQAEADPLFFKWQAGEATQEEWQAKREEIRQRYPK